LTLLYPKCIIVIEQLKVCFIYKKVIKFPETDKKAKRTKNHAKTSDNDGFTNKSNYNELGSNEISIYFSVYYISKGILTKRALTRLFRTTEPYSNQLKSLFDSNFPHTKMVLLEKNDLINAIRTLYTKEKIDVVQKKDENQKRRKINPQFLLKLAFVALISVYAALLLFFLRFPWYWIAIIDLIVLVMDVAIAWKDAFFFFTNHFLERKERMRPIDPFSGVQFYRVKRVNDSLFMHVNGQLLIGLKSFNLISANSSYSSSSSKFFRALSGSEIPFTYTIHASPTSIKLFQRKCEKLLNDNAWMEIRRILGDQTLRSSRKRILSSEETFPGARYPYEELFKWFQKRSGIWKTTLTLSCFSHRFTSSLTGEDFLEIERELRTNSNVILKDYEGSFIYQTMIPLKKNELISGFLTETLKNNVYRTDGTKLFYLYFQGKTLAELIKIASDLKKGVETVIAAEFITPTHLENYITIGKTINTEFLRDESPLGFTLDQVRNLLITNGNAEDRELVAMKIVSELVKKGVPSIIFDFSGNWTKLIKYFKKSRYANEFLCFKLGSSFNINLLDSEIKYDKNNFAYLNYFYDAYALAFKEQKKNVDSLKDIVSRNQQHSLSSITFDLQMMQKWERSSNYDDLYRFFTDFNQQCVIFSDKLYEFEGKITPEDFLKDDKVVILDLSVLTDLEQNVFCTFVLLSKIIHYIKNFSEYSPKMVVIPYADLFFDSDYLDSTFGNRINYGKVDKFLDPLIQNGFGTILLANQIRYLHPNVFNYAENIITFKATDKRDVADLKGQMNLQELKSVYSAKRNNTYQIEYLANMKGNEVIVKRKDINQPFPGKIDFNDLSNTSPTNYYEIVNYMKNQGYNLKLTEEKILDNSKKTIFELDLVIYSEFKEEIKNCLASVKALDKIALSKDQINDALNSYVIPKASKKTKDKKQLREIRDLVFALLVKHDYLETTSRKDPAGNEAMRTTYVVGKKYEQAVKDEFESKKSAKTNEPSIEMISAESNQKSRLDAIFQENAEKEANDDIKNEDYIEDNADDYINAEFENNLKSNPFIDAEDIDVEKDAPTDYTLGPFYKDKIKELYTSTLHIYKCLEKNQISNAIESVKSLLDFIEIFHENGKKNGNVAILKQKVNEINANDAKDPNIILKIATIYTLFASFYDSIREHINRRK